MLDSDEDPVGFVTKRLEVSRLAMTELHAFHDVWGDPLVIVWGASEDLEATRHFLRRFVDRRFNGIAHSGWVAVHRRDDGRLVDVVLKSAYWNPELPEIGWHFARFATLRSRSTGLTRVRCCQ